MTPTKKRGRPRNGEHREHTQLAIDVRAALAVRRAASAAGPRTLADLARTLGCSPQSLNHAMAGTRQSPTEAQIRAALPELPIWINALDESVGDFGGAHGAPLGYFIVD